MLCMFSGVCGELCKLLNKHYLKNQEAKVSSLLILLFVINPMELFDLVNWIEIECSEAEV